MNAEALTRERILDTAEQVLRRFGPRKTTVVDVARALQVSHGTVYRHFPTKADLRDAVAARWLDRVSAPLDAIVAADGPAPARLRRWLDMLIQTKRSKVRDDPEMFAAYSTLAEEARLVVAAHVDHLVGQVAQILADGRDQGAFAIDDPQAAARAVFDATLRFHHPAHHQQWDAPGTDAALEGVWRLVLAGLTRKADDPPD